MSGNKGKSITFFGKLWLWKLMSTYFRYGIVLTVVEIFKNNLRNCGDEKKADGMRLPCQESVDIYPAC